MRRLFQHSPRIAGLILLIPPLFALGSITLFAISSTGEFINSETLKRQLASSERSVWQSALPLALAYVNFYVTPREAKIRSGCLGPWLIYISFVAILFIYYYLNPDVTRLIYPLAPQWIPIALTIISVLKVTFCVVIWMWKKWGVFGYIAADVTTLVINLTYGISILGSFLSLSSIAIIGLLVKPKWQFFE